MKEHLDSRALGAIQWTDHVTRKAITQPLMVTSSELKFTRNLSGMTVIVRARGLEGYSAAFGEEDLPAATENDFTARVEDPSGRYLQREFTLTLPRDPSSELPLADDSVFKPVLISLLPGPNLRVPAGWANVRVRALRKGDLTPEGDPKPFRNVLVQVKGRLAGEDVDRLFGTGLSDARGEALVVMPEIPPFQPDTGTGELIPTDIPLHFELIPPNDESAAAVDWEAQQSKTVLAANKTTQDLEGRRELSFDFEVTPNPVLPP